MREAPRLDRGIARAELNRFRFARRGGGAPLGGVARAARFVHRRFAMPRRQTAQTAQPLSPGRRKALVAEIAKTASPKVRRGLKLIDFREPTERERAHAETLGALARRALARGAKQAA